MEGSASMGMAVAAITAILTELEVRNQHDKRNHQDDSKEFLRDVTPSPLAAHTHQIR
jgi:hypothetical protein